MEVRRVADPSAFLAAAEPFLLEDEARHNLILGIAGTLRDHPDLYPEHRLWLVENEEHVVGAALQTPPFNLVLARSTANAVTEALAEHLCEEVELPGVLGAIPEVDVFAGAWDALAGTSRRRRTAQRIYRLTEVRPVAPVPGRPRQATAADRPLLLDWVGAFADEVSADARSPIANVERTVDGRLRGTGGFLLWDDDEPVSLAGWGGQTLSGVRIGPVYTPPEHRRRGYASAVTAAVSADRLAAGRRFCFLYTDLANPTSNKIYMDIGYEPVCDSVDYAFDPR
ncbi:MAG: GNAT family N-acetyltransferase [Actinobacteria bacterium]|nr:GNAT family N-acetyltransferase [Actinomycetota bacterium]